MRIIGSLPPREIDGAEQVLGGVVGELASGNYVRFWPAMTYDAETNQTRIAFFTEWYMPPTPDDQRELMAYTDKLMEKPPELTTESKGDPTTNQENVEWLRSGKKPKPRRAN
ncbi:MAG TPA: hypothetical protein VFA33_06125 [Bryobacteraceae bacterium]|nr:hypothetical protein [Bryobacteraceae bacterium]